MKKALVLALTVLMVLSLATAVFAAEVTYEGKVEVTFGGSSQGDDKEAGEFGGTKEAKVILDFAKDFGDGVTAGVKTKSVAHEADKFEFDGEGYVKVAKDLFTAEASTGIDGGVGKDLKEFNIAKNAGLGVELKLIDGLTINTIVNNKRQAADAGKSDFNFLVKGEYAQDLFTVGGGFQNDAENEKTAFGVYGTANLIDGLTLNAEYGNRKEGNKDAITAILASAAYEVGALNVKGTFLMQDAGFKNMNDDDADQDWRIIDAWRFQAPTDVTAVAVDASYNLTEALKLEGYFDYLLSSKLGDVEIDVEDPYAYKAGVAYTFDALTLKGWFKAVGSDDSQFGGNATYKLAEGVDASFEVTSTTDKAVSEDAKLAYTAKVVATL